MSNNCFANRKDSIWTLPQDKGKPESVQTCYALKEIPSKSMLIKGWCGTESCPFYKPDNE